MDLTIVIPAFNEEAYLATKLDSYLKSFHRSTELIIVPNGCTDRTVRIAESYAQRFSNVRVVTIPEPVGKALAIRRGWQVATGEYVGFVDADASTSPEEFQRLVSIALQADGAIASRWAAGARVENRTLIRKLASYIFALFVRVLFWMPYRDTQCGAKVFRRSLLQRVMPFLRVTNIAFDVELLLLCRQSNARIVECPTHWVDRSDSVIIGSPLKLIRSSLNMLWTLLILRFRFIPPFAPRV